jgi:hypothetical protein
MTTYSTFNPYSSRPLSLPLQSRIATAIPPSSPQSTYSQRETKTYPETQNEEKKGTENSKVPSKPYPHSSLPSYLELETGLKFPLMNETADTATATPTVAQSKRIGAFHAILYGVPDPERFSYRQEMVAPGSFLHKILHGVKEIDHEEGVAAVVASATAVQSDQVGLCEGKGTEMVVVKDM